MNRTKRGNDSLVNSILFSDDSNNNYTQPINASQSTPGFQRSRLTPTRTFSTSPYKADYRYDVSVEKDSRVTPRFNKNDQGKTTKQPPLSSIFDQYSQDDPFQNKSSQSFIRSEYSASQETGALTTYPSEKEETLSSQPFLSPTIDYTEANWQKWVVVYGLPTDLTNFHPILSKFQKFGDIISFSAGKGNWLFIKFESSSNARRACVDTVLAYKDDLLLGVSQMTSSLALNLGVSLTNEGNISERFGSNNLSTLDISPEDNGIRHRKFATNELDTYRNSYINPASSVKSSDENIELYIRPQKTKNICEKIMSYFWSY